MPGRGLDALLPGLARSGATRAAVRAFLDRDWAFAGVAPSMRAKPSRWPPSSTMAIATIQLFCRASASAAAAIFLQSARVRSAGCSSLQRLPDLLERARVLDGRQVARIAPLGERLDRAAQQLARARLRQQRSRSARATGARSRRAACPRSPSLPSPAPARLLGRRDRSASFTTAKASGIWPLSWSATPTTAHLGDVRVRVDRLLDLARAEAVAGDVDHVVGAAEDEVVAVLVADAPVEGRVHLLGP